MTTTTRPRPTDLRRRARVVLGAVIAACGVWAVLRLAGVDLDVTTASGRSAVGLPAVALAALVAGSAGWALLAALERWAPRPHRAWRVLAGGVLAVSLLGPVAFAPSPTAVGGLVALHVAVGAALFALPGRTC